MLHSAQILEFRSYSKILPCFFTILFFSTYLLIFISTPDFLLQHIVLYKNTYKYTFIKSISIKASGINNSSSIVVSSVSFIVHM
jgi:hypothetical protein